MSRIAVNRRFVRSALVIAVVAILTTSTWTGAAAAETAPASTAVATAAPAASVRPAAADLSQFRPGNLITDAVFYDSGTMTEAQIQSFLQSKSSTCRAGFTCLKDWYDTSRSVGADAMCGAYSGGSSERASRIIYKVAQACGINPQAIIVMLQKEQGLVTHSEPSSSRYRIAMGQGCPDTAACDSRYFGFFNQVYGAAWQLKRYGNPPGTSQYFTWYAPGKTWNVRFNPDAACGSSPVFIENQATAALYYYTPYQPNAAALRAGYGTGNSCSAYGNRNFYNYFNDWFGATHPLQGTLITGPARDRAYLVNAGGKHPIASPVDLEAFGARLGGLRNVTAAYLDSLPTRAPVSRYVHDPRTGTLLLLELDGTRHRFATPEQISSFGYAFTSYVNLDPYLIEAFTVGEDVGALSRSAGTTDVFYFQDGQLRLVHDALAREYAVRVESRYIATMDPAAHARLPQGATFFAPNTLIKGATSGDVLLTTPTNTVVHIPSFALAAEFGATRYSVVPDALLAKSVRTPTQLTPLVRCGDQDFIAAGGVIRPLSGSDTGLPVTTLAQADCAAFPQGAAVQSPIFVQATNGADVYAVREGKLSHVHGYENLMALNGARPLTVLRWSSDTLSRQTLAAPLLFEGQFVQFTGAGEVYRNVEGRLRHVADYASLVYFGGGRVPTITSLDSTFATAYTYGDRLVRVPAIAEGAFVRFTDGSEIYRYSEGALRHVTDYATLVSLGGGRVPTIATVPREFLSSYAMGAPIAATPQLADGSFVQFSGTGEVYQYTRGELRHVTIVATLIALGGNRMPPIATLPLSDRASFRIGSPL